MEIDIAAVGFQKTGAGVVQRQADETQALWLRRFDQRLILNRHVEDGARTRNRVVDIDQRHAVEGAVNGVAPGRVERDLAAAGEQHICVVAGADPQL